MAPRVAALDYKEHHLNLTNYYVKQDYDIRLYKCPRCRGKGELSQFYHIFNGICFLCWGKGTTTFNHQLFDKMKTRTNPTFWCLIIDKTSKKVLKRFTLSKSDDITKKVEFELRNFVNKSNLKVCYGEENEWYESIIKRLYLIE